MSDYVGNGEPFGKPTVGETLEAERGRIYGDPLVNHERIAALWSVWLERVILPSDVAMCMVMVKQARLIQSPDHEDSMDDKQVYSDFYRRFRAAGR